MRIDTQSHIWPEPFLDYLQTRDEEPLAFRDGGTLFIDTGKWRRTAMPGHSDMDAKVRTMDAAGIDLTVLSPNDPGPERFGDDGPMVARLFNDYIAEQTRAYPGRFAGLCVLPLYHEGRGSRGAGSGGARPRHAGRAALRQFGRAAPGRAGVRVAVRAGRGPGHPAVPASRLPGGPSTRWKAGT